MLLLLEFLRQLGALLRLALLEFPLPPPRRCLPLPVQRRLAHLRQAWTLRGTCRYEPEPCRSLRGRISGRNHPMPIMRLRLAAQNLVMVSRKPTGFPTRFDPPVIAPSDVDEATLLAVAPYCQPWRPAAKIKTLEAADMPFFIIF